MKKIGKNYTEIVNKAKEVPALEELVEEYKKARENGYNVKKLIEEIKEKLTNLHL